MLVACSYFYDGGFSFIQTNMASAAGAMTTKRPESKQICCYFFNEINPQSWKLNHLRTCVGDNYCTVYNNARQENALNGFVRQISNTEREMFEWMEFVIMKNLSVGFVDCPYTCKITRLKPESAKTLRHNTLALFKVLQQAINDRLPNKCVLIFDGWTEGTEHFIALLASFTETASTGKDLPVQVTLSMKPLLADSGHDSSS